jgi:hypothetical protein
LGGRAAKRGRLFLIMRRLPAAFSRPFLRECFSFLPVVRGGVEDGRKVSGAASQTGLCREKDEVPYFA